MCRLGFACKVKPLLSCNNQHSLTSIFKFQVHLVKKKILTLDFLLEEKNLFEEIWISESNNHCFLNTGV